MSGLDILIEKIANYSTEKLAARAWKREIGNLSDSQRKKLEDKGILNYDKERRGLNRGTDNILKKYNVEKLTGEEFTNRITDNLSRVNIFKHFPKKDIEASTGERIKGGFGAIVDINNKNRPGIMLGGDITKKLEGTPLESHGKHMSQKNRAYVRAMTKRHETDEIRSGVKNLKNKKLSAIVQGQRLPVTDYAGHMSPKVVMQESAHTAVAPKEAKDFFDKMREFTGEKESFRLSPGAHEYGKSGTFNNSLSRKLNRLMAKAGKQAYKSL